MNIFLIGYRCTGKTSVGRLLSQTIDWPFTDTDDEVVQDAGQSITNIVKTEGWEGFRRRECKVLARLFRQNHQVIATGGGVILDQRNVTHMQSGGHVIWLRATAATIQKRMNSDASTVNMRPALTFDNALTEVETVLHQREALYAAAQHITIDTDDLVVEAVVDRIVAFGDKKGILNSGSQGPGD